MSPAPTVIRPRLRVLLHAGVLALCAGGAAGGARAQTPADAAAPRAGADAPDAAALTPADSASLRRQARDAQARFERRRRALLPVSRLADGRCDVRIGRFCYWYEEGAPSGPPEPARVGEERRRLLGVLDALAVRLPADSWLVGQRVRYRLEA